MGNTYVTVSRNSNTLLCNNECNWHYFIPWRTMISILPGLCFWCLGFEQVCICVQDERNLFIALEAYLVTAKNIDAVTTQFSVQVTHQAEKQSKLPQLWHRQVTPRQPAPQAQAWAVPFWLWCSWPLPFWSVWDALLSAKLEPCKTFLC